MCEIHLVKPMNRVIKSTDVNQLINMMKLSASINKDGFGLTNGEDIFKRESKYEEEHDKTLRRLFKESSFMIAHNRFKTSGTVKKRNSHPFENSRFIWVHNGIIRNDTELEKEYKLDTVKVDSEVIGEILLKKSQDEQDLVKAIEITLKEISGSLSVLLWDKETKRMFYFRHSCSFTFKLFHNEGDYVIIGSTDDNNMDDLYRDKKNFIYGFKTAKYETIGVLEPKEDVIYEISDLGIMKVGKFEVKEFEQHYVSTGTEKELKDFSYEELAIYLNELLEFSGVYRNEEIKIEKLKEYESKKKYKMTCSIVLADWLKEEFKFDVEEPHKHKEIVELIESIELYYGYDDECYYWGEGQWNRRYRGYGRGGYVNNGYGRGRYGEYNIFD